MELKIGPWMPAPAVTTRPIFAIGDVHGAAQKFRAMHELIIRIAEEDRLENPQIIHCGDYIDRGPQSMEALKRALTKIWVDDVALPGNHDQFLRMAMDTNGHIGVMMIWFKNYGDRFATELGFSPKAVQFDPAPFLGEIRKQLGPDLLEAFYNMPVSHRHGRYLFVHAGIHPSIPLDEQLDYDWRGRLDRDEDESPLWVRGPFLTHEGCFEEDLIVVHGHTAMDEPEIRSNRINLDTYAYYPGGALTCVQLMGDRMRFLQVIH